MIKNEENRINNFISIMGNVNIDNLFVRWLINNGFFTAPSSTKYHGAYEGGLYNHSKEVTLALVNLTKKLNLEWQSPRSPYVVGMFHDLCKIDSYNKIKDEKSIIFDYNTETYLTGHGDKSVVLLSTHMQLTEEEMMCIRYHMGAFCDKEEWSYYTRAVNKYPNVLYTHTADMIASQVNNI